MLRRLVSRRRGLAKRRTQAKNEISAVVHRNLKGRPPMSDPFGRKGRIWLAAQELPTDERLTVDAALRQLDFLAEELAAIDRLMAEEAQGDEDVRRLLTILGAARHVLVEAAWMAARSPGPLHAFAARIAARRGRQVATVAVARKLCVLCWCLLSRGEDYAFARPSLVRRKLRRLELTAGAPHLRSGPRADPVWNRDADLAERRLAELAERAHERLVADWSAVRARAGAGATPGRAS
jgi:transposase